MTKIYVSTDFSEAEKLLQPVFSDLYGGDDKPEEKGIYINDLSIDKGARLQEKLGLFFNPMCVITGKPVTERADKILYVLAKENLYVTKIENGLQKTPKIWDPFLWHYKRPCDREIK